MKTFSRRVARPSGRVSSWRGLSYSSARVATLSGASAPVAARGVSLRGMTAVVRRGYADVPSHLELGLPSLSPTMESGGIQEWVKKEGDAVRPGEVLAQVASDKSSVPWENNEEGFLAKILAPEGTQDIPVGRPVAILVEDKKDIAFFKDWTLDNVKWRPAADPAKPAAPEPKAAPAPAPKATPAPAPSAPPAQPAQPAPAPQPADSRVFASPLARASAKSQGIDVAAVAPGSGPAGRVVNADVARFAAALSAPGASGAEAAFTDAKASQIRRVTAQRLTESKQQIPHYYLTMEVEVDRLMAARAALNKRGEKAGYKLSVNDFLVKAAALSMRHVPVVNASWMSGVVRQYHDVHVNVAVNTDAGLFVPVVRHADRLGLVAIAQGVRTLAEAAKAGKLAQADMEGGTFTISNLGMFGLKGFAAVINPPQAAILAVGGVQKRVVMSAEKKLEEKQVMEVTLSCDHRVVDGAVGAEWLQHFKRYCEDPLDLLL